MELMDRRLICFITLLFLTVEAGDWGFFAHKQIHACAVESLPQNNSLFAFFSANKTELVQEATRPDRRRFRDKEEGYKHYINLEYFQQPIPRKWEKVLRRHPIDSLKVYGTAPWHIQQIYLDLVRVMKAGNKDSILYFAADLGHYLADLHVPLHTTRYHDGKTPDQKGIHALWESILPERFGSLKVISPAIARKINVQKTIFRVVEQTHQLVPMVLQAEQAIASDFSQANRPKYTNSNTRRKYRADFILAYDKVMHQLIQQQFDWAVFHVASFWYTAYLQAGKPAFE